jgi:integrase/recombinase XerD
VTWRDVDFRNSVVRVTAKPIWKFKPKNYEERAVPLPAAMIEQLQQLKVRRNATPAELIFPNTKGKPNSLHIEVVKEVAYRAKLNCGQCVTKHGNRCAQGPYCQRFYLHKFRHTFATEHLRHGIDVRTLQAGWGTATFSQRWFTSRGFNRRMPGEGECRVPRRIRRLTSAGEDERVFIPTAA